MSSNKRQTIKPLAKFVLAKVDAAPTKTASGLYLPEDSTEKSSTVATVEAVGPEVKSVKAGEKIIYEEYSGTKIKHYEEEYILVPEDKVLAVVS